MKQFKGTQFAEKLLSQDTFIVRTIIVMMKTIAGILAISGVAFATEPVRLTSPGASPIQPGVVAGDGRGSGVSAGMGRGNIHGTWLKGPGTYTLTICAIGFNCDIEGNPGGTINLRIDIGGGGGAGGDGVTNYLLNGEAVGAGSGGRGGDAGANNSTLRVLNVPANGSRQTLQIVVGAGGRGENYYNHGKGGMSEIKLDGTPVVSAEGGVSGDPNVQHLINVSTPAIYGHPGGGPVGCVGGIGGAGGVDAWGIFGNNGGNGGHGGYFHKVRIIPPVMNCTAQSSGNGWTSGSAGANGGAKIVW